jgi:glycosyltransferase involved in cell wall biosynthesis
MTTATLSVIVPNFNHAGFVSQALAAILGQSRVPDEIIVLDDASTDNSVEVIQGFIRKDPRIRLVQNPINKGVIATVNAGFEMASGTYVHSAAADDLVLPGFYEESMALLTRHPQAGFCSTLSHLINENGSLVGLFPSAIVSHTPGYF